jgi:hypothetical protein
MRDGPMLVVSTATQLCSLLERAARHKQPTTCKPEELTCTPDTLLQVEALPEQHGRLVPQLFQLLLQLQVVPADTQQVLDAYTPGLSLVDHPKVCKPRESETQLHLEGIFEYKQQL